MSLEDAINRLAAAIENAAAQHTTATSSAGNPAPAATPAPEKKKRAPAAKLPPKIETAPEDDDTAEHPEMDIEDEETPAITGITLDKLREKMVELQKADIAAFRELCAQFGMTKLAELTPDKYDRVYEATVKALTTLAQDDDTISLD